MKKAAALKTRTRRKPSSGSDIGGGDASVTSNDGSHAGDLKERRPPVNRVEEALSSKNYRLARELSELRIRHRDETKAVTRLTMENMNLAARVREAMSHVAMLKREISIYHQKTAELMRMQQQQEQQQQQKQQQHKERQRQHQLEQKSPSRVLAVAQISGKTATFNSKSRLSPQDVSLFPNSASPEINQPVPSTGQMRPKDFDSVSFRESDQTQEKQSKGDDTFFATDQSFETAFDTSFPGSFSTPRGFPPPSDDLSVDTTAEFSTSFFTAVGDKENQCVNTPRDYVFASESSANEGQKKLSSPEVSRKDINIASDFSTPPFQADFDNVFNEKNIRSSSHPSPKKAGGTNTARALYVTTVAGTAENYYGESSKGMNNINDGILQVVKDQKRGKIDQPQEVERQPPGIKSATDNDLAFDAIWSSPDPFGEVSPQDRSRKCHLSLDIIGEDGDRYGDSASTSEESPPRIEKSPGRAKSSIERKLGDAKFERFRRNGTGTSMKHISPESMSEEIRKLDEIASSSISPNSPSSKSLSNHNSEEMRNLDAIAHGTTSKSVSSTSPGPSKRRGIRQPVSYAEPSLSAKLRRGDVFFPKDSVHSKTIAGFSLDSNSLTPPPPSAAVSTQKMSPIGLTGDSSNVVGIRQNSTRIHL